MTSESAAVWERITAAFPPTLPTQPVTKCDCDECQQICANLGYLRWVDVLPPAAEKSFGALPLLTDEAFHALLPVFLFRALEDISPENKFLEWTLYALCGAYEEDDAPGNATDAERRRRIAGFTQAQRNAVRAFLTLVSTAPLLDFHHQPIQHALSAIWL